MTTPAPTAPWTLPVPEKSETGPWADLLLKMPPRELLSLFVDIGVPRAGVTPAPVHLQALKAPFLTLFLAGITYDWQDNQIRNQAFSAGKIPRALSPEAISVLHEVSPAEAVAGAFLLHGEAPWGSDTETLSLLDQAFSRDWQSIARHVLEHPQGPDAKTVAGMMSEEAMDNSAHRTKANRLPWLHAYVACNTTGMVDLLIGHGLDVDQKDRWGRTPLFYARTHEMVRYLVEAGANTTLSDDQDIAIATFWSTRAIAEEALPLMSEALGGISEDVVLEAGLVAWARTMFKGLGRRGWGENVLLDWPVYANARFERKGGNGGIVAMNAMDAIGLQAFFECEQGFHKLNPSHDSFPDQRKDLARDLLKGHGLVPLQGLSGEGFMTQFLFHVAFNASSKTDWQEKMDWNHKGMAATLPEVRTVSAPYFKNHTPEGWARLVKDALVWLPMVSTTGHRDTLTRFLNTSAERCGVTPAWVATQWAKDLHEGFASLEERNRTWTALLRAPELQSHALGLQPSPLPAPGDSVLEAAQWNAWATTFQALTPKKASLYREKGLLSDVEDGISDWLKRGVAWDAETADRKWFAKNAKLPTLGETGRHLATLAQQGAMGKSIRDVAQTPAAPLPPRRRL
jgi:hypothetical protein